MKIDRIETFLVPPRWLFCRVETDDGLVGWGEPVIEGRAEVVRTAVEVFAQYLIGKDPLAINDHWQVMSKGGFYRGGPEVSSAVAGIDQALWDIAGKSMNCPVHVLLGGHVRDRVRMYSWVGGDEPSQLRNAVEERIASGFTAVKMNASGRFPSAASAADTRAVVQRAEIVREVLGPERDMALDFHGRMSATDAKRLLIELAHLHPLFAEEPVLPEHVRRLPEVIACSSVPIALGERLYSRWDFRPALEAGIAVAQPDLSHAGGITEVRRIAALAETFDVLLAPHCPLGPIALAASLQLAFTTPNFLIQEQSADIHYNRDADYLDYVVDRSAFDFTGGYAKLPVGPGLGVEVDSASVRRADKIGHSWRNPIWRDEMGAFTEW